MSEEPTSKSKIVFQDFQSDKTLWFETAEDVAAYMTEHLLIDPEFFAVYELGKELTFKLVPT